MFTMYLLYLQYLYYTKCVLTRVVTVWYFDGMKISRFHCIIVYGIKQSKQLFFGLGVYSNFIHQKQSSRFHYWLYISLTTYIHH